MNVPNATARVALLGSNGARLRASSRLVPGLAAVVAEALLRRTVFCDMPHWRMDSVMEKCGCLGEL